MADWPISFLPLGDSFRARFSRSVADGPTRRSRLAAPDWPSSFVADRRFLVGEVIAFGGRLADS